MKILAFDTSTRALSLAVSDDTTILRYRNLRQMKFLSSSIMPAIQSLLKVSKLKLKDINAIIVGLGPGSFTSLRVGISTAKALAFANQIPVAGVSSLDTIALNVKSDGNIWVMNDARRGLVYACGYEKKGSTLKRRTDYLLVKPEEVIKKFDRDTIVIGDAVPVYKPLLKPFSKMITDDKLYYPDARHLIALGFEKLQRRGKGRMQYAPANDLNPIYLYPDNCQVHKT